MSSGQYSHRLHALIPGGAHTYSRGDDQFPSNAPAILARGKGAYVYDAEGREYLDYGMGLRAVACGYAEPSINAAAVNAMGLGNCLTRPSLTELEAADMLTGLLGTDMVKFTKNGSTATTAAVKLARAARQCFSVACAKQPFFSYDDWFIGITGRNKGCGPTFTHQFSNVDELKEIICGYKLACIILEPKDYDLQAIRSLCDKHGIILIFDEMITGFRYRLGSKTDVKPDLACFGKALGNGFSVACVTGKREVMELGAKQDMFLLSTTHGAEMCGLGAMMATLAFMHKHKVIEHLWDYGGAFCEMMRAAGLKIAGADVNPSLQFANAHDKTLFQQELIKQRVMMPWIAFSYAHQEEQLGFTRKAVHAALDSIANGAKLDGPEIRPVFA